MDLASQGMLPQQAYHPTNDRQMTAVVQAALRIDSWGLTLTEFGQPYGKGGFDLTLPKNFL